MSTARPGPPHASPPHPEHAPAKWGTSLGRGEVMEPEDLLKIPIFEGASKGLLEKNRGAVVRRTFQPGEIVCREGEFGSTAFYILEGKAEVFLSTPLAHVKTDSGSGGFFNRLKSRLVGRREDRREDDGPRRWIPIDAPVDLGYQKPAAALGPGDLFGEMTCMNFYPRSATVRATTECVMLEMLRNILDILLKNAKFRAQLDQTYRQRALEAHLRSVPVFVEILDTPESALDGQRLVDYLRDRVELVRFNPGQVICKQGDPADSFYLVRIGFVKVTESHPGGELVLSYLSRGNYFGEIGLLGGGVRTATCTALDHVEVVRIKAEDFTRILQAAPSLRAELEAVARDRREQNRNALNVITSVPLDDFLLQGLMEAQSLLLLDLNRCTRCDQCVRACADSHDGVTRLMREGLRYDHFLVATSCRQCRDPLCMVGCPVGSIRRRNTLEVIIEDWCIGCGLCAKNCPYGNINMHPVEMVHHATAEASSAAPADDRIKKAAVKTKAITCDLCSGLDEPSCVYACPHDAAHRVNPRTFLVQLQTDAASEWQRA
jgi:CRP-like cAMP-binding protein/Fe-S-cluster-containing hydrogenase component 2